MYSIAHIDNDSPFVRECQNLIRKVHNATGWNKWYVVPKKVANSSHLIVSEENLNIFVETAKDMLKRHAGLIESRFKADTKLDDVEIELHYCNSGEFANSEFDIHKDNVNGGNLYTFIAYFDIRCEGGELEFFSSLDSTFPSQIVSTCSDHDGMSKCIMFDGEIYHRPCRAKGYRCALSVQIPIV